MIDKIQAVGEYIHIIRDEAETERGGLLLPENSLQKPNTGKIISVGDEIVSERIKEGRTAIFSKQVGQQIEIFDVAITVINKHQLLGVI
jgi:co-chaperonin GroES (HSP10)